MAGIVEVLCQDLFNTVFDYGAEHLRRRLNRVSARLFPVGPRSNGEYRAFDDLGTNEDNALQFLYDDEPSRTRTMSSASSSSRNSNGVNGDSNSYNNNGNGSNGGVSANLSAFEEGLAGLGPRGVAPPDDFPQECRTALANLNLTGPTRDADEKVLIYTRSIFARRVFESVAMVVAFTAIMAPFFEIVFGLNHKASVIVLITLISLLILMLAVQLYFEYHGRSWIVVTSERIILIKAKVITNDIDVVSVYPPPYVKKEEYRDGSGELRFYENPDDWDADYVRSSWDNTESLGYLRLTHVPKVDLLFRAIIRPDSSRQMTSSFLAGYSGEDFGQTPGGGSQSFEMRETSTPMYRGGGLVTTLPGEENGESQENYFAPKTVNGSSNDNDVKNDKNGEEGVTDQMSIDIPSTKDVINQNDGANDTNDDVSPSKKKNGGRKGKKKKGKEKI